MMGQAASRAAFGDALAGVPPGVVEYGYRPFMLSWVDGTNLSPKLGATNAAEASGASSMIRGRGGDYLGVRGPTREGDNPTAIERNRGGNRVPTALALVIAQPWALAA